MNRKSVVTFAVAVLAIAAIADGLASRNIVGWATKDLQKNGNAMCAYFFNVNSAKEDGSVSLKLSDLTVTGYEGNYCAGKLSLQILDGLGRATSNYLWWEGVAGGKEEAGWYSAKDANAKRVCAENDNDVTFTQGDGLWVMCQDPALKIKSSGEVFMDDVCFKLRKNFQMIGNPYATTIKLSQITVSGYADNYCAGKVSVQILDGLGRAIGNYLWWEGVTGGKEEAGWYSAKDANSKRVCAENGNDEEFEAGKGLWVNANVEGLVLTIASPFEDKGDTPVEKTIE